MYVLFFIINNCLNVFSSLYRCHYLWFVCVANTLVFIHTSSLIICWIVSQMVLNLWNKLKFKSSPQLTNTTKINMSFRWWFLMIDLSFFKFWTAFSRLFQKCKNFHVFFLFCIILFCQLLFLFFYMLNRIIWLDDISSIYLKFFFSYLFSFEKLIKGNLLNISSELTSLRWIFLLQYSDWLIFKSSTNWTNNKKIYEY